LVGDWYPAEELGYSFSLTRPDENGVNMETDAVGVLLHWNGNGYAEDYTLFGINYKELITEKISYQSVDGPIKYRVYSLNNGPIRSLDFQSGGSLTTHGFDLKIE